MKLAIGPAATIAARGPTFLWWKLPWRSSSVMLASASDDGRGGLGVVAEELDITAERHGRNLPARAVAVVETGQFRPEAERERQHFHARPAGDQEMPEFVEENDDRQNEQKGDNVTDEPMAQRIETMQKKLGHPIPLKQSRRPCPQPSRMPLRQFEARGWQLYFARYGQRRWRRRRTSEARDYRSESSPLCVASTRRAMAPNLIWPAMKAATATSLAALNTVVAPRPVRSAS